MDSMSSVDRDTFLVEAVRHQIAFMRQNVPFWRERFRSADIGGACVISSPDGDSVSG